MMNTLTLPVWRPFPCVTSDAEAAVYSEGCMFSLATLEVACHPSGTAFALIERKEPGTWRWAVVDLFGRVLVDGFEPSPCDAKQAAVEALQNVPARATMCHQEPAARH